MKKWFEDWFYKTDGKGGIEIRMPNTMNGGHIIKFRKVSDARVKLLIDWWMCAMDQIQKDNGGYKK